MRDIARVILKVKVQLIFVGTHSERLEMHVNK